MLNLLHKAPTKNHKAPTKNVCQNSAVVALMISGNVEEQCRILKGRLERKMLKLLKNCKNLKYPSKIH